MPNSGYLDKKTRDALTPNDVYRRLLEGNQRFSANETIARDKNALLKEASQGQNPMAFILSCIDSRVPVEHLFDLDFGDVFVGRVAGHVICTDQLASMEFAKLIVVMGHTDFGAIKSAVDEVELGNIGALLSKIKPAVENIHSKDLLEITKSNVAHSLADIYQKSFVLKKMIDAGEVGVIGAVFNVGTGKVEFSDFREELQAYLIDEKLADLMKAVI